MHLDNVKSIVESIIFAADHPVSIERLREVLGDDAPAVKDMEDVLESISEKFQDPNTGIEIRRAQGGYQFCTKALNAEWVRRFLETRPFRLSRASLETLAIVSYRQPITRAEIDQVRGMDSSHLLRTLMEREIVKMVGKADVPGRPVQYGTTPKFLELLGLDSLSDLPPLSELKELEGDTPEAIQDPIEARLEDFTKDKVQAAESVRQLDQQLGDITDIIKSTRKPSDEIFESREQAEIADENSEAVAAFQVLSRFWKRKKKAAKSEEESTENPPPVASEEAPPSESSTGN